MYARRSSTSHYVARLHIHWWVSLAQSLELYDQRRPPTLALSCSAPPPAQEGATRHAPPLAPRPCDRGTTRMRDFTSNPPAARSRRDPSACAAGACASITRKKRGAVRETQRRTRACHRGRCGDVRLTTAVVPRRMLRGARRDVLQMVKLGPGRSLRRLTLSPMARAL